MVKLNFKKDIRNNQLLEHMILNFDMDKLKKKGFNADNLDVKMTVNGVELPVKKVWSHIEKQLDRAIKEEAKKLVDNMLGNRFSDAVNEIENEIDELVEKFKNAVEEVKITE